MTFRTVDSQDNNWKTACRDWSKVMIISLLYLRKIEALVKEYFNLQTSIRIVKNEWLKHSKPHNK